MKKIVVGVLVVGLLVLAFFAFNSYIYNQKQAYTAEDYKNAEYIIEGERVRLVGGTAESEFLFTKYFGNEIFTDLDGDGVEDVAFILTQESNGSGIFYYAVAALKRENGYVGSDAYLLGDRIAPQSTTLSTNPRHKNVVVFNYADRLPGEPMSTPPSVGKSVYLKIDGVTRQWGTVLPNFEGESSGEMQKIKLYYYNSKLDTDESGNVLCSSKGLVPVEREVAQSQNMIEDTIRLLLQGKVSQSEKASGIDTEYPLEGFSLASANLSNGVLTLSFNDPQNQTVGGSCRVGVLWAQIEATAKQFREVKEVRFLPEDIFQP